NVYDSKGCARSLKGFCFAAGEVAIRNGQVNVAQTRKTGKTIVSVFGGVDQHIDLVSYSHDCLFNLGVLRVRCAVAFFGSKSGATQKGLVRTISVEDRQGFSPE